MRFLLFSLFALMVSINSYAQKIGYKSLYTVPGHNSVFSNVINTDVPGTINIQNDKKRLVIANAYISSVWRIIKVSKKSTELTEYTLEANFGGDIVPYKASYDNFNLTFTLISGYTGDKQVYALNE